MPAIALDRRLPAARPRLRAAHGESRRRRGLVALLRRRGCGEGEGGESPRPRGRRVDREHARDHRPHARLRRRRHHQRPTRPRPRRVTKAQIKGSESNIPLWAILDPEYWSLTLLFVAEHVAVHAERPQVEAELESARGRAAGTECHEEWIEMFFGGMAALGLRRQPPVIDELVDGAALNARGDPIVEGPRPIRGLARDAHVPL